MDLNGIIELIPNPKIPPFRPGDTVRVSAKVVEGERERTQVFEGTVIRYRNASSSTSFTVRRIAQLAPAEIGFAQVRAVHRHAERYPREPRCDPRDRRRRRQRIRVQVVEPARGRAP